MRHKLLPFFFFISIIVAQAQSKISGKPDDFVTEVKAMLITGKATNAEKLAADLDAVWNSGTLTKNQQKEIIDITQELYRKRMRVNPHFEQFFVMVTAGVNSQNMRGKQLDNMLEVIAKTVQNEDGKHLESFLSTASLYLNTNRIYQNTYYKLNASGGSFSFAYEGASKPAEGAKAEDGWGTSWDDEVNANGELIEDDGWGVIAPAPKKEDKKKNEKNRKESIKRQFIPAQPKVSGPVLKLENVNLTFVTPWDSTGINKTHGQLMLATNTFVGEGGTFDWQADGAPASAEIRKYSFNTSFAGFKAPDVTVSYPSVLATPVDGAMEWISGKRKTSQYPYPKFFSFTNDAKLKTLGDNITYTGGFSMIGDLIGSKPLDNSLSEIVVSNGGERKFRSQARNYTINDSLIMANLASVAIYQQKDSLTHPAMQLRYSKPMQVLTLTKDKGPYARTPFFDTFHKLEITAERLHWDLRSQDIDFSIINSKALMPVQIESSHYYSNNRYQQLVGIAPFHPLQILVGHAAKAKSNTFYTSDVARTTKLNEKSIKEASLAMQHAGYINYDPSTGYIEMKEKAWHYVRSSRNINDYDHLIIKSLVPSGKNATLNLADNKLTVRGVERISFNNDTASVYILPTKSEVHILKNRDIEFDGQVFASSLAFKGSKFKFNYDEFSIDLTKLDTVALMSRKRRAEGGEVTDQVLTGKNGAISGKLYINKPNNKSGKEYFADYPKFDAPVGAQVAFARPDVAGGAYDSTVYFDMPPFKLDSLASGKNVIGFDGTFNSGGIFPPIKTKLMMMPDETLGFYYQPGAKGLAAFGGKGVAYDTIMMSSSGIQSKGKLTYLTATLHAPVYTYYKNAVVTKVGKTAEIAEGTLGGTKFPVAKVSDYHMNWLPQSDTMYIQTQKEPMKVYKEEFSFKGVAKLAPGGLYGAGVVDNPVANVTSAELHFKQRNLSGNHATLVAKSDRAGRPAIKAKDMAFEYDLVKGMVDFESEVKGAASIEFPHAQYTTSMSSARWDMNKQRVSLKADENGNKNWFYSQHPQQEGLQFAAASGEYDLKANTILAGGVPYITVGDSYVVPDSGKVAVAGDATIKTLRNAKVIADTLQQYHKMYAGNIDVLSRNAFKGTAVHDYFNAASDSFKLTFTNYVYGNPRGKKKPIYTFAEAQADEKSQFYIFPRILYRGKIMMHAPKEHFDFEGDLKLNFTGNPADSDWFSYKKDSLNPANVRIPITKPKAADGTPLHTGLHISRGSSKLYNTFVSKKQDMEDLDLFVVDGLLSYNKEKSEFKMGREGRAYQDSYEGNMLLYNEASNTVRFEGKLNLVKQMKNFNIEASGSGDANVDSSRYNLDAFMAFDLSAHSSILNTMASSLKENVGGTGEALDKSEATMYKLAEFIGDREARQYGAAMEYVPLPKLSKKLLRSIVINKADLRWSNELKAWYSVGKISVASMLKEDINAQLNGYLEIRQDMNGEPAVNLYLQANPNAWYYISFLENSLTIYSADEQLNKQVRSKAKGSRGASSNYGVYEGSDIDKNTFLEHFRKNYLNGEDGFKVAAGQPANALPASNVNYPEEEPAGKEKKKKRKKDKNDPFEENTENNN
ncbi:hypothetical protein [uncultured Pontibacter sp.]|uniref:hypothetical protein n=1 Tax=uncultured Pontibacter sp. TaxID=453356 RepID=UPI00260BB1F1|nr:hypothetical protein [uncultured Pontibacter sp.]